VLVLLDAMRLLSREEVPVELDILGYGDLLRECKDACQSLGGASRVRMLGTVPYDSASSGPIASIASRRTIILAPDTQSTGLGA